MANNVEVISLSSRQAFDRCLAVDVNSQLLLIQELLALAFIWLTAKLIGQKCPKRQIGYLKRAELSVVVVLVRCAFPDCDYKSCCLTFRSCKFAITGNLDDQAKAIQVPLIGLLNFSVIELDSAFKIGLRNVADIHHSET